MKVGGEECYSTPPHPLPPGRLNALHQRVAEQRWQHPWCPGSLHTIIIIPSWRLHILPG